MMKGVGSFLVGLFFGLLLIVVTFISNSNVCQNQTKGVKRPARDIRTRKRRLLGDVYVVCDGKGEVESISSCGIDRYLSHSGVCESGDRCKEKPDGYSYSQNFSAAYYTCENEISQARACDKGDIFMDGNCVTYNRCADDLLHFLEPLPNNEVAFCDDGEERRVTCNKPHEMCGCLGFDNGHRIRITHTQFWECVDAVPHQIACPENQHLSEDLVCVDIRCEGQADGVPFTDTSAKGYFICNNGHAAFIPCKSEEWLDTATSACLKNGCIGAPNDHKYHSGTKHAYYQCQPNGLPVLVHCGQGETLVDLSCVEDLCQGKELGTKIAHPLGGDNYYQCGKDAMVERKCVDGVFFDGKCQILPCTAGTERIPYTKTSYIQCGPVPKLVNCPDRYYFDVNSCRINVCIGNTFAKDPDSRIHYMHCVNGYPERIPCPEGHFYQDGSACTPHECADKDDGFTYKLSHASYATCFGHLPTTTTCAANEWLSELSLECEPNMCIGKPEGAIGKADNNNLYKCENEFPVIVSCKGSLIALPSGCGINPCRLKPNYTKIRIDFTNYYVCIDGYPEPASCLEGTVFLGSGCVTNECFGNTTKKLKHKVPTMFYNCKSSFPLAESCPPGMIFGTDDCVKDVCRDSTGIVETDNGPVSCATGAPIEYTCPPNLPLFNGQICVESPCVFDGHVLTSLDFGTHQNTFEVCDGNTPVTVKCAGYFDGFQCRESFCGEKGKEMSKIRDVYFECRGDKVVPLKCGVSEYLDLVCEPNPCFHEANGELIIISEREYITCVDNYPEKTECSVSEYIQGGCRHNDCYGQPETYTFPHLGDPKSYYSCETGIPVVKQCPHNRIFLNSCVDASCIGKEDGFKFPVQGDKFSYRTCAGSIESDVLRCPDNTFFSSDRCVPNPCVNKVENVKYRTSNSKEYFTCEGNAPVYEKCTGQSSFFDVDMLECNRSGCLGNATYPGPSKTSYYSCEDLNWPKLITCDTGHYHQDEGCSLNPCSDPDWVERIDNAKLRVCASGYPEVVECLPNQYVGGRRCIGNPCFTGSSKLATATTPSRDYIECLDGYPVERECALGTYYADGDCVKSPCGEGEETAPMDVLHFYECVDRVPVAQKRCPADTVYEEGSCVPNICLSPRKPAFVSNEYVECIRGLPQRSACPNPDHLYYDGECKESMCSAGMSKAPISSAPGKGYYDCDTFPPGIAECEGYLDVRGVCSENGCETKAKQPIAAQYYICSVDNFPVPRTCDPGFLYIDNVCVVNPCTELVVPIDNMSYYYCSTGIPERIDCPEGEWFDSAKCVNNLCGGRKNQNVKNPKDPYSFYHCDAGGFPTLTKCSPSKQYFEDALKCKTAVCVDPSGTYPSKGYKGFYTCDNYFPSYFPCESKKSYCTNHNVCHANDCNGGVSGVKDLSETNGYLKCRGDVGIFVKCKSGQYALNGVCVNNMCKNSSDVFEIEGSPRNYYSCAKGIPVVAECDVAFVDGSCVDANPCEEDIQFRSEQSVAEYYECRDHLPYKRHCGTGRYYLYPSQACVDNHCLADKLSDYIEPWGRVICRDQTPDILPCGPGQFFLESCIKNPCESSSPIAYSGSEYIDCKKIHPDVVDCGGPGIQFNPVTLRCETNPCFPDKPFVRLAPPSYLECVDQYPVLVQCYRGQAFTGDLGNPCAADVCRGLTGNIRHVEPTKFYECTELGPVANRCALPEQYFDPDELICKTSGCYTLPNGSRVVDPSSIYGYFRCENSIPVKQYCKFNTVFYSDTMACEADRCGEKERKGNPADIRTFFACQTDRTWVLLRCPSGEVYDADLAICVTSPCTGNQTHVAKPDLSGFILCGDNTFHACPRYQYYRESVNSCYLNPCVRVGEQFPDPENVRGFVVCAEDGIPVERACAATEIYLENQCVPNHCSDKSDEELVRHHTNIHWFYRCRGGVPYTQDFCPDGEIFVDKCRPSECREGIWGYGSERDRFFYCANQVMKVKLCKRGRVYVEGIGCRKNRCLTNGVGYKYSYKRDLEHYFECDDRNIPNRRDCPIGQFFSGTDCVNNECYGKRLGHVFGDSSSLHRYFECPALGIPERRACDNNGVFVSGSCRDISCTEMFGKIHIERAIGKYLNCSDGRPSLETCPDSHYFSKLRNACLAYDCDRNFAIGFEAYGVCVGDDVVEVTCNPGEYFEGETCVGNPCVGQPRGTRFPHKELTKYSECDVYPRVNSCRGDLVFLKNECRSNPCSSAVRPHRDGYFACVAGVPRYIACPAGESYIEDLGVCAISPCPGPLKYPIDDHSFLVCKGDKPVVNRCFEDLVFADGGCNACAIEDKIYPGSRDLSRLFYVCKGGKLLQRSCESDELLIDRACWPNACLNETDGAIKKINRNTFAVCTNNMPAVHDCPSRFVLNEANVCVPNACEGSTTNAPHPVHKGSFYVCFQGEMLYRQCPEGNIYSVATNRCIETPCKEDESGFKRSPVEKHAYYICPQNNYASCGSETEFMDTRTGRCLTSPCIGQSNRTVKQDDYFICGPSDNVLDVIRCPPNHFLLGGVCELNPCAGQDSAPHPTFSNYFYVCESNIPALSSCSEMEVFYRGECVQKHVPCSDTSFDRTYTRDLFACEGCLPGHIKLHSECEINACANEDENLILGIWHNERSYAKCLSGKWQVEFCPEGNVYIEEFGCVKSPCIDGDPIRLNLQTMVVCDDGLPKVSFCDGDEIAVGEYCHPNSCVGDRISGVMPENKYQFIDCLQKTVIDCSPGAYYSYHTETCVSEDCENGGYYDARVYFTCESGKKVTEGKCRSENMVYSFEIGMCVARPGCTANGTGKLDRFTFYICDRGVVTSEQCPVNRVFNSALNACEKNPCTEGSGLEVHPERQDIYYVCEGNKFIDSRECPAGHIMFVPERRCVPAPCGDANDKGLVESPRHYIDCAEPSSPKIKQCPENVPWFDRNRCTYDFCGSRAGLFPVPYESTVYVECGDGQRTRQCPEGLFFHYGQCIDVCNTVGRFYRRYEGDTFVRCVGGQSEFVPCPDQMYPVDEFGCAWDPCIGKDRNVADKDPRLYYACVNGMLDSIKQCEANERYSSKYQRCLFNNCTDGTFAIDPFSLSGYVACGSPIRDLECLGVNEIFDLDTSMCVRNVCANKADGHREAITGVTYFECVDKRPRRVACEGGPFDATYMACV